MKNIKVIYSIAFFLVLFITSTYAEVKLPAIVSSNMVLQRNTTIVLWGWADADEKIAIKTSWLDSPFKIQANKEGNWRIEVKTNNSKQSQSIIIKSKASNITLENILFGEVWLCSGQSNMEMALSGWTGQPISGSTMAIAKSTNSNLRLFTVNKASSKTPLKDIEKFTAWQQASPNSVSTFSAVAYFYGQQLQEILDCPVGLIHVSWGGSKVEAWMSKDVLSSFEKVDLDNLDSKIQTQHTPTILFNALISPLIPYTIKGVLWYQGESNHPEPEQYKILFPAMVKDWRTRWGLGDFPFYYVQIAPFLYGNNDVFQAPSNTAFMREAQLQCLDLISNSGIAITLDLGNQFTIHPPKKKEVADRLLFNALNKTYGLKTIHCVSPTYKSQEVKGGGIILKFINVELGLYSNEDLAGFEIAGEDKVFYPASAKVVEQKNVLVTSDKVTNPVAVRYAWRNWFDGSLRDINMLPASSFRTDKWDDATRNTK